MNEEQSGTSPDEEEQQVEEPEFFDRALLLQPPEVRQEYFEQRCHAESFIVGNLSMRALPVTLYGKIICPARRHTQCRMTNGFVLLIGPLLNSFSQSRKRPHREPLRISRTCILAWLLRCLRITEQVIEKLCLHRTKQALLGRAKPRLCSRALMLAYSVEGQ